MQKHEPWLLIAQEDLVSANHLHSKVLTTTLFHVQQCAEKSLKAYLVLKHDKLIKTHDLVQLVDLCIKFNILRSNEEMSILFNLIPNLKHCHSTTISTENIQLLPLEHVLIDRLECHNHLCVSHVGFHAANTPMPWFIKLNIPRRRRILAFWPKRWI